MISYIQTIHLVATKYITLLTIVTTYQPITYYLRTHLNLPMQKGKMLLLIATCRYYKNLNIFVLNKFFMLQW